MTVEFEKLVFEVEARIGKAEAELAIVEESLRAIEKERTAKINIEVKGEGEAAAAALAGDLEQVTQASDKAESSADRLQRRFADVIAKARAAGFDEQADKLSELAGRLDTATSETADLRSEWSILAGMLTKAGLGNAAKEALSFKPEADDSSQAIDRLGAALSGLHPNVDEFEAFKSKLIGLASLANQSGFDKIHADIVKLTPRIQDVDNKSLHFTSVLKEIQQQAGRLGLDKGFISGLEQLAPRLDGATGGLGLFRTAMQKAGEGLSEMAPSLAQLGIGLFVIIPLIGLAAGAIVALGAAVVALISALAPLVGLLGVIPSGLALLGQALGTVFLAFSRVKGALELHKKAQDDAKASTTKGKDAAHAAALAAQQYASALHAEKEAAEAVALAQRKLNEATERYNRVLEGTALDVIELQTTQKDSINKLAEATKNYSEVVQGLKRDAAIQEASDNATQAQLALRSSTERLYDAQKRLQDLLNPKNPNDVAEAQLNLATAQDELRKEIAFGTGSLLDRQAAELKVAKAQEALNKLLAPADEHEVAQARLAVDQANFDVDKSTRDVTSTTKDLLTVQNTALEDTKDYKDANIDLQRAITNVAQSQEGLTNIQKTAKEQWEAATESLSDASYSQEQSHIAVQNAAYNQSHATDAATQSATAYKDALKELTPEGQKLVEFLGGMTGFLKQLQDIAEKGMLGGVLDGLKAAAPLFDSIKQVVGATAPVLGSFASSFGAFLGSPFFTGAFTQIGKDNADVLTILLSALQPLTEAFTNIMIAAKPLFEFLAQGFKNWADSFLEWTRKDDGKALNDFFAEVIVTVDKVMTIIGNFGSIFGSVLAGGKEEGTGLLDTLVELSDTWSKWAKDALESGELQQFFKDVIPSAREILSTVGEVFKQIFEFAKDPDTQKTLRDIFGAIKDAVPIFRDLATVVSVPIQLLGDLFNIIRGLYRIVVYIPDKIGEAIRKIWDIIWKFFDDLIFHSLIPDGVMAIVHWFTVELPTRLLTGLADIGKWLLEKGWELLQGLWDGILNFWKDVFEKVFKVGEWVFNLIGDVTMALINKGWDLISGLWQGILNFFDWIGRNWKPWDWFTGIFDLAGGALSWLKNKGWDIISGMWSGIVDGFEKIFNTNFKPWDWITGFFGSVEEHGKWLFNIGSNIITGLWNGIGSVAQKFIDWLGGFVSTIVSTVADVADWLLGPFINFGGGKNKEVKSQGDLVGTAVVEGILRGIQSMMSELIVAVRSLAGEIIRVLKAGLKVSSPSQITENFGAMIAVGLANGIYSESAAAINAAQTLADGVSNVFDPLSAGSMSFGVNGLKNQPRINPSLLLNAGFTPTQVINQYTIEGSVITEKELADRIRSLNIQTGQRNASAFGRYA